jgi:hypothetical protein
MFHDKIFSNIEMSRRSGMNSTKTVAVNNRYMYSIITPGYFQTPTYICTVS